MSPNPNVASASSSSISEDPCTFRQAYEIQRRHFTQFMQRTKRGEVAHADFIAEAMRWKDQMLARARRVRELRGEPNNSVIRGPYGDMYEEWEIVCKVNTVILRIETTVYGM
ncbi:hypothetical protein EWM64_g2674 [Hericium alpestre]|uniref:Uncharacterized protein n=1 Tax=Hericium alpestre TaxID=135208 RepID=A0A4Z0A6Q7_9AGAM|nr:hypothetical protein EWM64_g2674 [Hericium alpestre]